MNVVAAPEASAASSRIEGRGRTPLRAGFDLQSRAAFVLAAVIIVGGVWAASRTAILEYQAHTLAAIVSDAEASRAGPRRVARLSQLSERLDLAEPWFGGAPRYWDATSRGYLIAASDASLDVSVRLELLDKAETAAYKALQGRAVDHGPWSRLAAIDVARDGVLSPSGAQALRNAVLAAPYRERLAQWRLIFMAPLWEQLPLDLREQVLVDAEFLWSRPNEFVYRRLVRRIADVALPAAQAALRTRIRELDTPAELRSTVPNSLTLQGAPDVVVDN